MSCCGDKKDFTAGSSSFDHCLCDVIRTIKDIQDAGTDECMGCNDCFMEPLGGLVSPGRRSPVDTRVISLLTKDGSAFKVSTAHCPRYCKESYSGQTCFFRIERIIGKCCVTLRALEKVPQTPAHPCGFIATDVCLTVDIRCFCGVTCVTDCFLDICD